MGKGLVVFIVYCFPMISKGFLCVVGFYFVLSLVFLNKIRGTKRGSIQLFVHYYVCLFLVFLFWIPVCLLGWKEKWQNR